MITLVYFARLREAFGCETETLAGDYADVAAVIATLVARGGAWAEELGGGKVFRVAVNQEMARLDDAVPVAAEVAIFPPVTGG